MGVGTTYDKFGIAALGIISNKVKVHSNGFSVLYNQSESVGIKISDPNGVGIASLSERWTASATKAEIDKVVSEDKGNVGK